MFVIFISAKSKLAFFSYHFSDRLYSPILDNYVIKDHMEIHQVFPRKR